MKALTLWQPWAFAICALGKRIENRTWRPPARMIGERIALHAGKRIDGDAWHAIRCDFHDQANGVELVLGAIVATATLSRVLTLNDFEGVDEAQDYWFAGPLGWLLADVRVLETPIYCKGAQGLWTAPEGDLRLRECT